jgi:serine/threonine protein phosphatase 1
LIIIGDIHGSYLTFLALLAKLPKDDIFITGDLIDRGPRSAQLIDYLMKHPKIRSVKGNHEAMATDEYLANCWMSNGGWQTLDSYAKFLDCDLNIVKIPQTHLDFMKNLPLYIIHEGVLISHSFVKGSLERATHNLMSDDSILWSRGGIPKKVENFQVFGHTPQKKSMIRDYWACIDTGCCFKQQGYGVLTALQYPSMQIYQQENID